jgi:hypothetical protein
MDQLVDDLQLMRREHSLGLAVVDRVEPVRYLRRTISV